MPPVQTSYTATMQPGLEGQAATMVDDRNTETRICETVAGIGFGRAVSEGANARGAVLGGATKLLGVTMIDTTLIAAQGGAVDVYPRYSNMGVLLSGDIWVKAVNGCTHGAPATYDAATGQFNPVAAGVAIPGSRWITSATAGNLALLRLTAKPPGA